jgi:hypothetical protein
MFTKFIGIKNTGKQRFGPDRLEDRFAEALSINEIALRGNLFRVADLFSTSICYNSSDTQTAGVREALKLLSSRSTSMKEVADAYIRIQM